MAPPRRRWFRFGLRTMFVLLTLACSVAAWVGYSLNWIRERHAFLEETHSRKYDLLAAMDPNELITKSPWLLRAFGERAVYCIWTLNKQTDVADGERAKRLFPEARVYVRSTSPGKQCLGPQYEYVRIADTFSVDVRPQQRRRAP